MSHVFQIVTGIITGKIASVRDISSEIDLLTMKRLSCHV